MYAMKLTLALSLLSETSLVHAASDNTKLAGLAERDSSENIKHLIRRDDAHIQRLKLATRQDSPPITTDADCSLYDGYFYVTPANYTWQLQCSNNYGGSVIVVTEDATSLSACIQECANINRNGSPGSCVAVTFAGAYGGGDTACTQYASVDTVYLASEEGGFANSALLILGPSGQVFATPQADPSFPGQPTQGPTVDPLPPTTVAPTTTSSPSEGDSGGYGTVTITNTGPFTYTGPNLGGGNGGLYTPPPNGGDGGGVIYITSTISTDFITYVVSTRTATITSCIPGQACTTQTTTPALPGPTKVGSFALVGCLSPKPGSMFFNSFNLAPGTTAAGTVDLTVEKCISECTSDLYAAMFQDDCYCSKWPFPVSPASDFVEYPASYCNQPCPGNAAEKCGGTLGSDSTKAKRALPSSANGAMLLIVYTNNSTGNAGNSGPSSSSISIGNDGSRPITSSYLTTTTTSAAIKNNGQKTFSNIVPITEYRIQTIEICAANPTPCSQSLSTATSVVYRTELSCSPGTCIGVAAATGNLVDALLAATCLVTQ